VADAVRVAEFTLPAQMEGEPPSQPPFTAAVLVSSQVRLDQLGAELAEATELAEVALLADGDTLRATEGEQVHIWTEADIPADVLVTVTQRHRPDPDWASGEHRTAPQLDAIRTKATRGQALTMDEIQVAIGHLLLAETPPVPEG
jgi:hypothetical protein